MRFLIYFLSGLLLIISSNVHARPVSYPEGWTLMLFNDGDKNTAHIHYSPTAKTSVGYKFEYWRDKDLTINAVQINRLIKRWNRPESQANFYLKSGIGIAQSRAGQFDGDKGLAGFSGIAADWEDRRRFISYENRYTEAGKLDDFFQQTVRLGWAPYEGDYGDLHTWTMLQIGYMPEADHHITVTPLLRFFKRVHLVETGMNNRGEILFNYIFRY